MSQIILLLLLYKDGFALLQEGCYAIKQRNQTKPNQTKPK